MTHTQPEAPVRNTCILKLYKIHHFKSPFETKPLKLHKTLQISNPTLNQNFEAAQKTWQVKHAFTQKPNKTPRYQSSRMHQIPQAQRISRSRVVQDTENLKPYIPPKYLCFSKWPKNTADEKETHRIFRNSGEASNNLIREYSKLWKSPCMHKPRRLDDLDRLPDQSLCFGDVHRIPSVPVGHSAAQWRC